MHAYVLYLLDLDRAWPGKLSSLTNSFYPGPSIILGLIIGVTFFANDFSHYLFLVS